MSKITLSPKHSPDQMVTCKGSSFPKAMICHPGKLCLMPGGAQLIFKQSWYYVQKKLVGEAGEKVEKAAERTGLVLNTPFLGQREIRGHVAAV